MLENWFGVQDQEGAGGKDFLRDSCLGVLEER